MPICFFKNKDFFLYIFGSSWFFLVLLDPDHQCDTNFIYALHGKWRQNSPITKLFCSYVITETEIRIC